MTENISKTMFSVSKSNKNITTNASITSANIRATQTWISAK